MAQIPPIVSTCTPFPGTHCVTTPVPPTVGPMGPTSTGFFDDVTNLVLPIERNEGMVASILGVAYFRADPNDPGSGPFPLAAPLVPVYLAIAELNEDGTASAASPRAVLVNDTIRHFTIWSDGERSAVPPFRGGGKAPYGFVISTGTGGDQLGKLMYWWRWVPRATGYPSVGTC